MTHQVSEIIGWLDFFLVNNEKAGIEMKMILQPAYRYDEDYGAVIGEGTIVAYDDTGRGLCKAIYMSQPNLHFQRNFNFASETLLFRIM